MSLFDTYPKALPEDVGVRSRRRRVRRVERDGKRHSQGQDHDRVYRTTTPAFRIIS
jgi:hypothetical protein